MTEWHMRFMSIKMSPSFIDPPLIASTLRLGIWMILNASEGLGFLCLFATVCSTWVSINVGTSRRSRVLPEGDWRKPSVWWSNCMVSRNLGIMCLRHIIVLNGSMDRFTISSLGYLIFWLLAGIATNEIICLFVSLVCSPDEILPIPWPKVSILYMIDGASRIPKGTKLFTYLKFVYTYI